VCERRHQIWSVGGKGWTLFSLRYDTLCDFYFVCWEGAMAEGGVYSECVRTVWFDGCDDVVYLSHILPEGNDGNGGRERIERGIRHKGGTTGRRDYLNDVLPHTLPTLTVDRPRPVP